MKNHPMNSNMRKAVVKVFYIDYVMLKEEIEKEKLVTRNLRYEY